MEVWHRDIMLGIKECANKGNYYGMHHMLEQLLDDDTGDTDELTVTLASVLHYLVTKD